MLISTSSTYDVRLRCNGTLPRNGGTVISDEDNELAAFAKLGRLISETADLADQSEKLVRAIHRAWKDAGGTVNGKPRHSDRFLVDQLKASGFDVKSLTPKLVGRTRIKGEDASILIKHFLAFWPQKAESSEASESDAVQYGPLLSSSEIDQLAWSVTHRLSRAVPTAPTEVGPIAFTVTPLPGEDIGVLLPRLYAHCDCLFTVGTERPVITQHPRTDLWGFRNLMNVFRRLEVDNKIRPLVWVLDMGRQVFEESDVESRQRYMGVQALITRLKALRDFDDQGRQERWEWLRKRALFVVLDTRLDQTVDMTDVRRPNFHPHHLSFTAIAPTWASNSNFRTLYGSDFDRLDQRSFSVFFRAEGWEDDEAGEEEDTVVYRRYFGYAQFTQDVTRPNADRIARGLELPSPGASYEQAYRTAYAAAVEHLGLPNKSSEAIDGTEAAKQLRYLGFRLLGLDEFMA
jgi:hypothetical protein